MLKGEIRTFLLIRETVGHWYPNDKRFLSSLAKVRTLLFDAISSTSWGYIWFLKWSSIFVWGTRHACSENGVKSFINKCEIQYCFYIPLEYRQLVRKKIPNLFAAKAIEQCSLTQISDQCILRMRSRSKKAGGAFVSGTQKVLKRVLNILCFYLGLKNFQRVVNSLCLYLRHKKFSKGFSIFWVCICVSGTPKLLQRVLKFSMCL